MAISGYSGLQLIEHQTPSTSSQTEEISIEQQVFNVDELALHILSYVGLKGLLVASFVSRRWHAIVLDHTLIHTESFCHFRNDGIKTCSPKDMHNELNFIPERWKGLRGSNAHVSTESTVSLEQVVSVIESIRKNIGWEYWFACFRFPFMPNAQIEYSLEVLDIELQGEMYHHSYLIVDKLPFRENWKVEKMGEVCRGQQYRNRYSENITLRLKVDLSNQIIKQLGFTPLTESELARGTPSKSAVATQ